MTDQRFGRLSRWTTGAILSLVLQTLGTSSSAWASCDRHAALRLVTILDQSRLDSLILGHGSPRTGIEHTPDPLEPLGHERPVPCSGPGCSNRIPPPVPMGLSGFHPVDQWGLLGMTDLVPIRSPRVQAINEPTPFPSGQSLSIFHPPRTLPVG